MENIFKFKDLFKQSFLQKLFKKFPSQNFIIEVNNLLSANPVLSIEKYHIADIVGKYGANLGTNNVNKLANFYSDYLIHCLNDKKLSSNEMHELKHLKEVLSLSDKEVEEIHNKTSGAIYKKSINEIIADGVLDRNEEDFLNKLQLELQLPIEVANKISQEVRGQFVQEYFSKTISDERLSPQEVQQFELICRNMAINFEIDDQTKSVLDKYKLYWVIENSEIPIIPVPILLEKSETCYFHDTTEWYEKRTITQRVNYRGPTASIRIMKGVRYRVGSIKPQRITTEEWKRIDTGTLYLTNKRIIFLGQNKNSNIRLNKIVSFTPYTDAIEIAKDTGRSPILKISNNNEMFCLILSRLLNE